MISTRASQQVTALFLLIILGGNFSLSIFWHQWRVSLLWHDHIILGPLYPGWEDHHGHRHPRSQSKSPPADVQFFVASNGDSGASTKIISLYQSLVGGGTILSFDVQLLWLAEWPILSGFPSLDRPLEEASLAFSSVYLPPPDRPPSPLFNKS